MSPHARSTQAVAPGPRTLARLIDVLGPVAVHLLTAPGGLDVQLNAAVIHDPESLPQAESGDLVLAVGVRASHPHALDVVRDYGRLGAGAVALRLDGLPPPALLAAAVDAEVALVAIPSELRWAQFHLLARAALASSGLFDSSTAGSPDDLFAFANAIATMIGGAVTVEDTQSRVVAYSNLDHPIDDPRRETILGRRIPDTWMQRNLQQGVFERLWSSDRPIRIEADPAVGLSARLVVRVRAGDEMLGSIWIAEGSVPLDAAAEEELARAAPLAALHLLKHRSENRQDRPQRTNFVRGVLEGRAQDPLLAERYGIVSLGAFTVIGFAFDAIDEAGGVATVQRAVDLVTTYIEGYRASACTVELDGRVYTLLPVTASDAGRLVGLAQSVVDRALAGLRPIVRCGVGGVVEQLRDVPRSRAEVDLVLRVLEEDGQRSVTDYASVRGRALLLQLGDNAVGLPRLLEGPAAEIVAHDRAHGSDHAGTLRAYLDASGNVAQAAVTLGIHQNTFRYRMTRIAAQFHPPIDDPIERLVLHLQLHLVDRAASAAPGVRA